MRGKLLSLEKRTVVPAGMALKNRGRGVRREDLPLLLCWIWEVAVLGPRRCGLSNSRLIFEDIHDTYGVLRSSTTVTTRI